MRAAAADACTDYREHMHAHEAQGYAAQQHQHHLQTYHTSAAGLATTGSKDSWNIVGALGKVARMFFNVRRGN